MSVNWARQVYMEQKGEERSGHRNPEGPWNPGSTYGTLCEANHRNGMVGLVRKPKIQEGAIRKDNQIPGQRINETQEGCWEAEETGFSQH